MREEKHFTIMETEKIDLSTQDRLNRLGRLYQRIRPTFLSRANRIILGVVTIIVLALSGWFYFQRSFKKLPPTAISPTPTLSKPETAVVPVFDLSKEGKTITPTVPATPTTLTQPIPSPAYEKLYNDLIAVFPLIKIDRSAIKIPNLNTQELLRQKELSRVGQFFKRFFKEVFAQSYKLMVYKIGKPKFPPGPSEEEMFQFAERLGFTKENLIEREVLPAATDLTFKKDDLTLELPSLKYSGGIDPRLTYVKRPTLASPLPLSKVQTLAKAQEILKQTGLVRENLDWGHAFSVSGEGDPSKGVIVPRQFDGYRSLSGDQTDDLRIYFHLADGSFEVNDVNTHFWQFQSFQELSILSLEEAVTQLNQLGGFLSCLKKIGDDPTQSPLPSSLSEYDREWCSHFSGRATGFLTQKKGQLKNLQITSVELVYVFDLTVASALIKDTPLRREYFDYVIPAYLFKGTAVPEFPIPTGLTEQQLNEVGWDRAANLNGKLTYINLFLPALREPITPIIVEPTPTPTPTPTPYQELVSSEEKFWQGLGAQRIYFPSSGTLHDLDLYIKPGTETRYKIALWQDENGQRGSLLSTAPQGQAGFGVLLDDGVGWKKHRNLNFQIDEAGFYWLGLYLPSREEGGFLGSIPLSLGQGSDNDEQTYAVNQNGERIQDVNDFLYKLYFTSIFASVPKINSPEELVKTFEEASLKHDAEGARTILALFSKPQSVEEQKDFEFLQGKELNYPPRLFNAVSAGAEKQTLSYEIISIEKEENSAKLTVKEQIRLMTFSMEAAEPVVEKTQEYVFELTSDPTLGWKVLRYYPKDSPGAFSGFYR